MNTNAHQTAFHPYQIINEGRSTLQLRPGKAPKIGMLVLRFIPLLMVVIGGVLFVVQKEIYFLLMFVGIALFEGIIFSFITIPAALSMDSMGLTLETYSIKGRKETYYLWSEIDFIRHRMFSGKNSTTLNYAAVLKTGKKVSFLNFNNYHKKKQSIPEINAVLHTISKKEIREN